MRRFPLPLLLMVAVVLWYAFRAIVGWIAGPAYSFGRHDAAFGHYEAALANLTRGSAGMHLAEARWLAAQVRIGIWQNEIYAGTPPEEVEPLLLEAFHDYTAAISISPASGWYWAALGDLYHQRERLERHEAGFPLDLLAADPWERVGRPGRIAVGMLRHALSAEPTVHALHDQLAFTYRDYGLSELELLRVRESARVQPVYRFHAYENLAPVPDEILAAFTEGSREALGKAPFLRRNLHLLALGRIEVRRGRMEQAEADLRDALALPGEALNRSEGRYYLGLVLSRMERYDEALEYLIQAEEHPNFEAASISAQAWIAESTGRSEEALLLLGRARRLNPRNLGFVLSYARVARAIGDYGKAEQALRWGILTHSRDPRPYRALVVCQSERGDLRAARVALEDLAKLPGVTPAEVEGLILRIEAAEGPIPGDPGIPSGG